MIAAADSFGVLAAAVRSARQLAACLRPWAFGFLAGAQRGRRSSDQKQKNEQLHHLGGVVGSSVKEGRYRIRHSQTKEQGCRLLLRDVARWEETVLLEGPTVYFQKDSRHAT